ncbi:MAG: hypothetical protein ACHQ4J_12710 [Candidatus Binatia bacterium]
MLRELPVTQPKGEPFRRWYADDYFDLFVWTSDGGAVVAFELCYDKPGCERALIWSRETGWGHFRVDSGEATPIKNRTPILVSDGSFPKALVVAQLTEASTAIDPMARTFVLGKLQELAS